MKNRETSINTSPQFPRSDLLALTGYFLLTVLMTWPAALHLAGAIPGDGFDGWQNYWNLWWVKQALLVLGTNPFFTDYLYPPPGASLLFHTLNIFNGLWTLPLQLNFGLAIAYNSIVFFSFVLAGYGGYLLSLYSLARLKWPLATGLRPAAFVGGLIFTMSPFHMAHLLGHMQVFSMIWPPFYILWLLRSLEPWAVWPRYSWRKAALSCLFLILATLVDWYHTLYLLIFTGLVLLWVVGRQWLLLSRPRSRQTGRQEKSSLLTPLSLTAHFFNQPLVRPVWIGLAIGLGAGLLLSPLLLPMIRQAGARPELQTGLAQNITLSADLLAFITPSELHPIWGEWAKNVADNFSSTTSERLIFAGFVPLALGLFIIIRAWRELIVKFWALAAATFFVLALGPFLHIGGKIISLGDWPIPMPYLLLYNTIPFIGLTRSLSRYDLMVMLSLGVLTAIAIARIQLEISNYQSTRPQIQNPKPVLSVAEVSKTCAERSRSIQNPKSLCLLVTLLICFEFLPIPYPVSKIDTPRFYFDIGAEADDYTIAELPMNWDRPTTLLHQVTHGKRLLTAYTSRDNPLELAWRTPVFQHWRYLAPDIIDQPLAEIAPTIFFDFNLRYIVLDYWQMPPGPEREASERWLSAALPGLKPIYDDGRLKVYQSPPKQQTQPYLTLDSGWSERQENGPASLSRTFKATAENQPALFLHHPQERPLVLEITAAASVPQNLTVFADGEPVGQFQVRPIFSTQSLDLPPLANNMVKLRFRSDNPASAVSVSRIGLRESE